MAYPKELLQTRAELEAKEGRENCNQYLNAAIKHIKRMLEDAKCANDPEKNLSERIEDIRHVMAWGSANLYSILNNATHNANLAMISAAYLSGLISEGKSK